MKTIHADHSKFPEKFRAKAARLAGILFIFNLLVPTLAYVFIQSSLFVKTSSLATSGNVIENQALFSFGIISELALVTGLIGLGYSLYLLLRRENQHMAFLAFILKCIEAALMAVVTLLSFLAFLMLIHSNSFDAFSPQQIKSIAGFLLNQHDKLNSIPMILLGVEMVVFCALFVKSRLIPRWISWFGIFSFSLIFVYGILSVTISAANLFMLTLPSFIFELVIGLWLMIKGVSEHAINAH